MWRLPGQTYVYYHFATLAGPDLAEQLQNEGFCHIPGKITHVPRQGKTREPLNRECTAKLFLFSIINSKYSKKKRQQLLFTTFKKVF